MRSTAERLDLGEVMGVEIRGYFDCSGQQRDHHLTLGGYVASPEVWFAFEEGWRSVLASFDPPCSYLHMVEANPLRGEFSMAKGWNREAIDSLIQTLIRECFLPAVWSGPDGPSLLKLACTIERTEWAKACGYCPELEDRSRATVCARWVAEASLRRLPQDPQKPSGHRRGTLELFFDRDEPFQPEIESAWQEALRRPKGTRGPLSLISSIKAASMKETPALQAADFLVWHINRSLTQNCRMSWWRTFKSCLGGKTIRLSAETIAEWHKVDYDGNQLQWAVEQG